MQELLLITFTFGIGIFTFLSMLEKPVWSLIFTGRHHLVTDESIRFVHRNLRFMTSKLPPSNGGVILLGTSLLIWQGFQLGWEPLASSLLITYIAGLLVIVAILGNARTVFSIRRNDSDTADLDLLIDDLKKVGRDHHIGLALNLTALIMQLIIIWR